MNRGSLIRLVMLLSFFVTLSCNSSRQVTKTENQSSDCLPLQMVDHYEGIDSDFYDVQEMFVKENCLNLILTYGGGCGEINYEVFYDKTVMESYPPQVFLKLKFTDNDPCRAIEMDTISIDLSYFNAMARAGGINIGIEGAPMQVTYALPLR
jgi:hypothetical protein